MKTMQISDPRFNNKHPIHLHVDRYSTTDNICLSSYVTDSEGFSEPWAKYTTNGRAQLAKNHVAIKDWGENAGVEEVLVAAGVIEAEPIGCDVSNGMTPLIFKLTPRAIAELGLEP